MSIFVMNQCYATNPGLIFISFIRPSVCAFTNQGKDYGRNGGELFGVIILLKRYG